MANSSILLRSIIQTTNSLSPVDFSNFDETLWKEFIATCSDELVTPSVATHFGNTDYQDFVPSDVYEYFSSILLLNSQRNQTGLRELENVARVCNENSVTPVVLKGMAGVADAIYPHHGYRVMGDIDILVRPTQLRTTLGILKNLQYQSASEVRENYFWSQNLESIQEFPLLIAPEKLFGIDLHFKSALFLNQGKILDDNLFNRSKKFNLGSATILIPNPMDALVHSIYHSQIQDLDYFVGRIRARYLVDVFKLRQRCLREYSETDISDSMKQYGLDRIWKSYTVVLEYFNAPRSAKYVSLPARYRLGLTTPGLCSSVAKIGSNLRATLRSPERFLTTEYYLHQLGKFRNR